MIVIRNQALELRMREDGTAVVLEDLKRRVCWHLDDSTRLVAAADVVRFDHPAFAAESAAAQDRKVLALGPGTATRLDDKTIRSEHRTPCGTVQFQWILEPDCLRILADPAAPDAAPSLALPGTFRPADGRAFLAAIPMGQGVLHTGRGPAFHRPLAGHGHGFGCNMTMFGQIADGGGLLIIAEHEADAVLHWEKTNGGDVRLMWLQWASLGRLAYARETVVYATPPDVTSICKCYRRYEIEHGRFRTWEQKIAERPALEKLFGSAIVFIGYHQDDTLDYAASFRRLKALGIDRAYVYPVYLDSTLDITIMGVRPVDIRAQLPLIHELGYTAGSFIYITDGPRRADDPTDADLVLDRKGTPLLAWQIKDLKWYAYSAEKRFAAARRLLDHEHAGLDGMHYDVLCCVAPREDYNPLHREDARTDVANRAAMLQYAGAANRIVSSEGFWGRMTSSYDLGSCKFAHMLGGDEYCVVPMTMLVYHDSAWHTWWEVDNYNNYEHRTQFGRGQTQRLPWGGGHARLQAAIDAIQGTPPDIFPFGLQYGFVPHGMPEVYTYRFRLEDALVQEAIAFAKPVMALNRRVGRLELTEHKLHRPDGAVQESVFADGTRVVANFANAALEAPGVGLLPPESWKAL